MVNWRHLSVKLSLENRLQNSNLKSELNDFGKT